MTTKEFVATIKRHRGTIEVVEAEIDKVEKQFLKEELARLDLHEGDIIEVEQETRSFYDLSDKIKTEWIRGYVTRPSVEEDDGDIRISLGALKKDGTPSAIGTRLYYVYLTGRMAQTIRKVK